MDWKKGDKGLDHSADTTVEGPVEVPRCSWGSATPTVRSVSEWARPKLQRAWPATSKASIACPIQLAHPASSDETGDRGISSVRSGRHSPLVIPGKKIEGESTFQDQLDKALSAQKSISAAIENMQAAMRTQPIKVANWPP